jgi:DNA-binding NarL/FixJ family response regulator
MSDLPRSCALVADDDEFFRIAISTLLKGEFGFEHVFEAAAYGEAAHLLATHDDIGLVLLELDLPGMQRFTSVAKIRALAPKVTLVVVSGSVARADILGALDLGAHGYIPKVTGPAELCRALRKIFAGDIYVPPSLQTVLTRQVQGPALAECDAAEPAKVHLTKRQCEVLRYLGKGSSNKEIARELGMGAGTVKIHVAAVLRALNLPNRSAVAAYAARQPDQAAQ